MNRLHPEAPIHCEDCDSATPGSLRDKEDTGRCVWCAYMWNVAGLIHVTYCPKCGGPSIPEHSCPCSKRELLDDAEHELDMAEDPSCGTCDECKEGITCREIDEADAENN